MDEYRQVEEELDEVIELLHRKYGFIDYNVGRNGEFDDLATQAVRRFRKEWAEWCELTLVEPYPVANLDILEKSYDNVIMREQAKEMCERITASKNYYEALNILSEYVNITSVAAEDEALDEASEGPEIR